jgi:molybdopterin molybdotransferase
MISVQQAQHEIILNSTPLNSQITPLQNALNDVLATDIISPISLPLFDQSSMDGYAIRHEDIQKQGMRFPVIGEMRAGCQDLLTLSAHTAIRVFTGAPIPVGTTAVVIQENVTRIGNEIIINEFPVAPYKNIRMAGQQICANEIAMHAGARITPGSVGFLLNMNISEVEVYRKPKIGIVVTGDELVRVGDPLAAGQVYESNASMLKAALAEEGLLDVDIVYVSDSLNDTVEALADYANTKDVILSSGGISVGDYDFVGEALQIIGAKTIFYKVKQKPGKPLLFAKRAEKLFFALPGNPFSSLVCFYEYVLPALRKMRGYQDCFLKKIKVPILSDYAFDGARDEFLKALVTNEGVMMLDGQESFALRSFAVANAFIYLPNSQSTVKAGEMVEVHLLPLN